MLMVCAKFVISFVIYKNTLKYIPTSKFIYSFTIHFVILKHALIRITICPNKKALPMLFLINEIAFIFIAI